MSSRPRPYAGAEPYIFVSYAHADMDMVFPMIRTIQEEGFRVWFDEGIDPGTEWADNIADHVMNCGTFLAFITGNYLESENCRDELDYARSLKKERLLVYLEEVELPPGLAMRMNRLQAIHACMYEEAEQFYGKLFGTAILQPCRGLKIPEVSPFPGEWKMTAPEDLPDWLEHPAPLARGGWINAYRCYDRRREEEVVVKLTSVADTRWMPMMKNPKLQKQILGLRHPNICSTYLVSLTENPFIEMEYAPGETLREELRGFFGERPEQSFPEEGSEFPARGPQEEAVLTRGLRLTAGVLRGLQALHAEGICYGDLSPENVIVSGDTARLCDFSQSAYNGEAVDDRTIVYSKYRSPDRLEGRDIDSRSDVYEVAALLDEMTLRIRVKEMSDFGVPMMAEDRFHPEPQAPAGMTQDAAHRLYGILTRALQRDREKRFSDAGVMLSEMEKAGLVSARQPEP